jgi:hypothetical protein
MRSVWWVIAAALLVVAPSVRADPSSRAVIDQIELEPSSLTGHRLRVHMSALSLQGQVLDLDSSSIKLVVGGGELKAPFSIGAYSGTGADTAIVFVIQTSVDYAEVLPVIAEALDTNVLDGASDRTQVAILTYGEAMSPGKLGTVKAARAKISTLTSDRTAGEPVLLDTLERALALLKKAKTEPEGRPLRKMIVVVGDGRDLSADRDRVVRIGTRAAKDLVRIHTFAFSPKDIRRPLLLLGELSKRSSGTFRWVRGAHAESWTPAFQQLRAELDRQMVLTFFLGSEEDVAGKKLKIVTTGRAEVVSNELKIPEAGCNGQPCEGYCAADRCNIPRAPEGHGVLGWILRIGGLLVGIVVLLGVIGFVMTRRQQAAADPAHPPGATPPPRSKPPKTKPPKSKPPSLAPPAAISQPPAEITGPRFYILNGPRTGEVLAVKHGFSIGKTPGCDLTIDDGYTSGHHAQIGMDHFGNCRVFDRGSTNGTFINGVRVTEYALEHGNTLRVGSTELRFLSQ